MINSKVIKEVIKILNIDEKRFPPRYFLSQIENWKNKGLPPEKVADSEPDIIGHEKVLKSIAAIKKTIKIKRSRFWRLAAFTFKAA